MRKIIAFWLIVFATIVCIPSQVGATPDITSVSGTIANGNSIIITGSSFGIKTTAAPLKWDNFEVGTVGNQISGWSFRSGKDIIKYNNTNSRTGSNKHVRGKPPHGYGSNTPARFWYDGDNLSETYVSYWWKCGRTAGSVQSNNFKFFNVRNDASILGHPTLVVMSQPSSGWTYANIRDEDGNYVLSSKSFANGVLPYNRWMRIEIYLKESSFNGQADGRLDIWAHRNPGTSTITSEVGADCETNKNGGTKHFRDPMFNEFMRDYIGSNPVNDEYDIDYDEIYIDNTQARVEIGDNVTWANCTHREIQIPSAWSGNSITITLNQGSFANCESAYLFVVDADGNVNTHGYPIRIVTGAGEAPCPPIGLKIK